MVVEKRNPHGIAGERGSHKQISKDLHLLRKVGTVLKSLRKSLGLLRRPPFEFVPRGKIASIKKRIQTGFLLSCFCFHLSIDVMSKLQERYKNGTEDSHILFPQIHQLVTLRGICFLILSVHFFPKPFEGKLQL